MHENLLLELNSLIDTENLAKRIAGSIKAPCIIFLSGDLGAGKTCLVKNILSCSGHKGNVKSPTYTFVETYSVGDTTYHHFDLYRLSEAEELEFIGFNDYLNDDAIILIEWPERGEGFLPSPDLYILLEYNLQKRTAKIKAETDIGRMICNACSC